jgi:23S rRNA (cytidine1920-2'-O)/16S rRNA (cytidine1409-2'-O)-methyltransferase
MGRFQNALKTDPRAKKVRLDLLLVQRGLAPSRERARRLILAGQVLVDDNPISKAGGVVAADAVVRLSTPDHPFVGRGGVKLAHALDEFKIDVAGLSVLDIGASTGGFTDALLSRGAQRVLALDVGKGQLDWTLRQDPRVVVIEGVNARHLDASQLPWPVDLVVIDVSFISARHILRAVKATAPNADVILLVKPQFEAGRSEVGKGGLVKDHAIHERVLVEITEAAEKLGMTRVRMTPSPITGATGNQEYLLHLTPAK